MRYHTPSDLLRKLSPTARRIALYWARNPGAQTGRSCDLKHDAVQAVRKGCFRRLRVPSAEAETLAREIYAAANAIHDARKTPPRNRPERSGGPPLTRLLCSVAPRLDPRNYFCLAKEKPLTDE